MGVTIWTTGHSTRPLDTFLTLLDHYRLEAVADVRFATLPSICENGAGSYACSPGHLLSLAALAWRAAPDITQFAEHCLAEYLVSRLR